MGAAIQTEKIDKAIKQASIAAFLIGVLTLVMLGLAMWGVLGETLAYYDDPYLLLDVLICWACAYAISRRSRAGAVFMLIYYLASQIIVRVDTGSASGLFLAAVFSYFLVRAVWATFAFHRHEKVHNEFYKPAWKKPIVWVASPVALVAMAGLLFSLVMLSPQVPSTKVEAGADIWSGHFETMVENGIIKAEDEILYFYSEGVLSVLEGGQLLTNDRVISYYPDDDRLVVDEIPYTEVNSIEITEEGGFMSDTVVQIDSVKTDAIVILVLSAEEDGDDLFIAELRAHVSKHQPNPERAEVGP